MKGSKLKMYKRLELRMFWVHSNSVEPKVQCTLSLLCYNKHLHQVLQRPYNFFLHWQASQEGFPKKKIREREEKCFFNMLNPLVLENMQNTHLKVCFIAFSLFASVDFDSSPYL